MAGLARPPVAQSPDIEVRNTKNATDPAWANVPWVGNPNTVVAKVRNAGNVLAPSVRVNFYVKTFNIGGAPEVFLGSDVRDIAAGATVEFTTNWVPPSTGHFCVVARIPLYIVPTAPTVVEMTELNNIAQSNYDRFNTATSRRPRASTPTLRSETPTTRRRGYGSSASRRTPCTGPTWRRRGCG